MCDVAQSETPADLIDPSHPHGRESIMAPFDDNMEMQFGNIEDIDDSEKEVIALQAELAVQNDI